MTNWNKVDYSNNDIMRMQQDAMRRVHDMQQRAQKTMQQSGHGTGSFPSNTSNRRVPVESSPSAQRTNQADQPASAQSPVSGPPAVVHTPLPAAKAPGNGLLSSLMNLLPFGKGHDESPISKVLEALDLDTERIIIILLMVVLYNEKADATLLLALAYLLI